jgi:hypothetical protein
MRCVPRLQFQRLARKLDGPRRSDVLPGWSQLLALVVGQVDQRHTLAGIECGMMNRPSLGYSPG